MNLIDTEEFERDRYVLLQEERVLQSWNNEYEKNKIGFFANIFSNSQENESADSNDDSATPFVSEIQNDNWFLDDSDGDYCPENGVYEEQSGNEKDQVVPEDFQRSVEPHNIDQEEQTHEEDINVFNPKEDSLDHEAFRATTNVRETPSKHLENAMETESSKTSEELAHLQFENSDDTRNAVKVQISGSSIIAELRFPYTSKDSKNCCRILCSRFLKHLKSSRMNESRDLTEYLGKLKENPLTPKTGSQEAIIECWKKIPKFRDEFRKFILEYQLEEAALSCRDLKNALQRNFFINMLKGLKEVMKNIPADMLNMYEPRKISTKIEFQKIK